MDQLTASHTSTNLNTLENRIATLESALQEIKERNRRVELNKSWETSRLRLLAITAITFVTMTLVFVMFGSNRPLLDALVPTTGFFLSTLSLSFLRALYERNATHRGTSPTKDFL